MAIQLPARFLTPRLTLAAAFLVIIAAPSLRAQRHRDGVAFGDTAEWIDDCQGEGRRSYYDGDDRERHCEVRTTTVRAGGGTISMDAGQNGSIAIRGGDVETITVIAKIAATASTQGEAEAIAKQVKINVTPTQITSDGPDQTNHRNWYVSFDVIVPRSAAVIARTHNGGVSLEGLTGRSEAHAVNGPVSIYNMSGEVIGRTQNGPVVADLQGTKWQGAGLDLQTTNGPVNLRIPDGYNAHLETGTVNGPMRFDFPVTVQGNINRRLSLELGKGGPTIRAVTTNGPVVVRRT
jgi:DUF4097 and DUF4098 domain-containing protein YvlB